MTTSETKKQIAEIRKFTKKITASKAESRKFLVRAGIATEKGNLRRAYR